MKTTIIPAQITTVEDRIAGSLNFTQIVLLMIPVIWTTIVFAFFAPAMHIVWYKVTLVSIVLLMCLPLSLRIKGTIVLDHLIMWFRYTLRPRIYVPMKTDTLYKAIDIPVEPVMHASLKHSVKPNLVKHASVTLSDLVKFERLLGKKRFAIRYKTNGKGGLNVAYEPIR